METIKDLGKYTFPCLLANSVKKFGKRPAVALVGQKEITYNEEDDYKKFLAEKDDSSLVKPEKVLIPRITPRKKEIISYKNKDVPDELLEARSFQNRHIPTIMQEKDKEALLEKIIEYGMVIEFRAFMNDLRNSNMIMSNQYTLLTYATKNKQYEIMKYLIHIGADVNKRDDKLDTPLNIAVRNNDMDAVQILINAKNFEDKIIKYKVPLSLGNKCE